MYNSQKTTGLENYINKDSKLQKCRDPSSAIKSLDLFSSVALYKESELMGVACPLSCQQYTLVANVRNYHINSWVGMNDQSGTFTYLKFS